MAALPTGPSPLDALFQHAATPDEDEDLVKEEYIVDTEEDSGDDE